MLYQINQTPWIENHKQWGNVVFPMEIQISSPIVTTELWVKKFLLLDYL